VIDEDINTFQCNSLLRRTTTQLELFRTSQQRRFHLSSSISLSNKGTQISSQLRHLQKFPRVRSWQAWKQLQEKLARMYLEMAHLFKVTNLSRKSLNRHPTKDHTSRKTPKVFVVVQNYLPLERILH